MADHRVWVIGHFLVKDAVPKKYRQISSPLELTAPSHHRQRPSESEALHVSSSYSPIALSS